MKYNYLRKLILSSITFISLFTLIPIKASAAWIKDANGIWSYTEGSSYATGWRQIDGIWYFFDGFGQMRTGWIQDDSQWYYADLSGAMQTGVIQIEGKIYFFASSGAMQKGQCIISGSSYNFNDYGVLTGNSALAPNKAFDYYGNSTIPYVANQIVSEDSTMSSDVPSDGKTKVTQYKVKFKDPDADSSDEELLKSKTVDEGTVISLYKPTKSGYTFVEWNTKSDGDGTSYDYGDTIKVKKDITLYAQWEEEDTSTTTTTTDTVAVTGIAVSSVNGSTSITTKGGSLQMSKVVSPNDATTQTVTWSVDDTSIATISSTGLLKAVSNGTVTIKATANDSSGVTGTFTVKISGQ